MELSGANLDQAVEISQDIYWVGSGVKSFLNRNSYLRIYKGSGAVANMLIDPGATSDLDDLVAKTSQVLGDPGKINLIYINHQDPDVVGNLPFLLNCNPRAVVVATEDTWRLVSLANPPQTVFKPVERFKDSKAALNTNHAHQMLFIPTPFCHFRGACMLYDLESRILFSGDFMGGVAALGLEATETNWPGIKTFHQLYMPSNDAIRLAIQKIRKLDPSPLMIAPQHGGIIKGELIEEFLSRMEQLQVGLDIITSTDAMLPLLVSALNEIIQGFRTICGEEITSRNMRYFHPDGSYPALIALSTDGVVTDIKGDPVEVVEALVRVFFRQLTTLQQNVMKTKIAKIFLERNLPPISSLAMPEDGEQAVVFA